jgi:hypothetical protein
MEDFESEILFKSPPELGIGAEAPNNAAKGFIELMSYYPKFSNAEEFT